MRRCVVLLALVAAASAFNVPSSGFRLPAVRARACVRPAGVGLRMADDWDGDASKEKFTKEVEVEQKAKEEEKPAAAEAAEPKNEGSQQYDLKKTVDKSGVGFNQFDPVLTVTGFISRRFGLVGGLAIVAGLAATEGKEIVAALFEEGPKAGANVPVKLPNGIVYTESMIGPENKATPAPGMLVGVDVEVVIADQKFKKKATFKYGSRPFTSIVCQGLEDGLSGMRVGGKRSITIPLELGPASIKLPPGVPLIYNVELTEVFTNYL